MSPDAITAKVKFLVDKRGRRTHAVLPLKDFEELLEELHDLALGLSRKGEPDIPLEEAFAQLSRHEPI